MKELAPMYQEDSWGNMEGPRFGYDSTKPSRGDSSRPSRHDDQELSPEEVRALYWAAICGISDSSQEPLMNSIKPSMNDSTGPSMSESTEPTMNSVEPSVSESTEPTVDSVEQGQVRIADWRQTQEAVKDVDPALLDRIVDWSSGLVEPSDDEGEEKGFYKAVYRIASETNGPSITIEIPNGSELGKKMQWRVALSFSNDGKSDWKRANVGKDGQVQAYRMNGGDDDKRDIVLLNNKQIEQLLGYLDEIKPHLERATK